MCGIFAGMTVKTSLALEQVERCTAQIKHRGPETSGFWIAPHRRVALGHARLAIVDLVTGSQPIGNETGTIHAVVNGEFYDYANIRRELIQKGHLFDSDSDSEIVIHLFEEYGTECLKYLRGEFAFTLWDEERQLLFAARDRFGIKPLYYAEIKDTLYLASEVKALIAAGVPFNWDEEALLRSTYFALPQTDSIFKRVKQVPPGYFLVAPHGRPILRRYWDIDFATREEESLSTQTDEDHASEIRTLLQDAVRIRLNADVPVACYLSGGLDSSAVLGIASQVRPLTAFSLKFDHPDLDESPIAVDTASHCGAKLVTLDVNEDSLVRDFEDSVWHGETLALNTNGVAKYQLSRIVRDHGFKVVLTGEGADEVFAGYPHFVRDMLTASESDRSQLASQLANLQRTNRVYGGLDLGGELDSPLNDVNSALGFIPSMWQSTYGIGRQLRGFLDLKPSTALRSNPYLDFIGNCGVASKLTGRHPVHQSMYLWSKTFLPNYILAFLGDRMEMAHSVEGRLPFLDHHLAEAAAKMPVSAKIRNTQEKFVLRKAVSDCVTNTVFNRQKHPFAAPFYMSRKTGPFSIYVQDMLRTRSRATLLNRAALIKCLDRLPSMSRADQLSVDAALTAVLSACVLEKKFRR